MPNYVFVLNGDSRPLSPCHPAVARKLLERGQATVERLVPFTIRLAETKPNPIVQSTTVGIDDGSKTAGIAIVQHNQNGDQVVFRADVRLRNNVKRELGNRRMRRKARRLRLRHRQPRHRRGNKAGWIPPSVEVRKDNVLRIVCDLARLVPISRIVYEEGQFDTRVLWDKDVKNYQRGPNNGFRDRKKAVLWRDSYVCQYCGVNCIVSGLVAEVDHVIPHSRGGTMAWKNLVCACRPCNQTKGDLTAAEFGHSGIQGRIFTYPAWLQQGKTYIKEQLERIAPLEIRYGWQTADRRKWLSLEKSHINDALALAVRTQNFEDGLQGFEIVARRRRQDMHNRKHDGFAGFKHWDIVRYTKRSGEAFLGTVRSFVPSHKVVKCRLSFNDNYGVSLGRLELVERASNLVYLPQIRKEMVS
ncbi:MAG: CRISPR-associated endonuclease Cas9 [Firmicutes bacterium]|nr:CRISPR-associated endonuclease Cas9 [Bacillota bacterium]